MRGLALPVPMMLIVGGLAPAADKAYPIFTPENFVNDMQLLGRNFGAVNDSLAQNDFETAKAQIARSRELLAITVTFWRDRKKDDAIKILRDTLAKIDDLDTALSSATVAPAAATAIARQVATGCQSCHSLYREQDPHTKTYKFKDRSVQ